MPRLSESRRANARDVVRQADQRAKEVTSKPSPDAVLRQVVRQADQTSEEWVGFGSIAAPARPLVRQEDQGAPNAGSDAPRVLIVGCGALARELVELTRPLPNVDVACLPPALHNRPGGIPARVRARIRQGRRDGYERIFVAYADCGTGGLLEPVLAEEGVERLPGAHCYEFFAGRTDFAALAAQEPATFWLTDFLARNFERLVIRGLGIDRNPELEPMYFGNYKRLVYLSQTDDPDILEMARRAADRLGLEFEHRHTGYGELATSILTVVHGMNTSDGLDAEAVVRSHGVSNLDTLEPRMSRSGKNVPRVNKSGATPATRVARVHGVNTRPNASTRTGAA